MNGNFSLIDLYLRNARHAELLKEAVMMRLAAPLHPVRTPAYFPALAWLGTRMMTWGKALQVKHGAAGCRTTSDKICSAMLS